jgi:hypothetical protein
MGKGRQQAPGDQVVRQTNLPEYADPYFRRLLQGAEEVTMPFDPETGASTYIPYQGERIAPSAMYGDIQASRAMVRGIAQSPIAGMQEAMGAQREGMDVTRRGIGFTEEGVGRLRGLSDYQTGEFTPFGEFEQYQFRDPFEFSEFGFRPDFQFQQAQFREPDRFTGTQVQDYMSPYMQSVVEQQQRQAQLEFERQGASRAAQAVQAGAFGGSRQAVQEALAEEALGRQMGDIQAFGSQAAFEQAAQQFGSDRAARMAIDQARAGELARVQSSAAAEQARVDQARYTEMANRESAQAAEFARAGNMEAAEAARVQAARYDDLARRQSAVEQSRQFGASQALAAEQGALGAASQMGTMAQGLGSLGQSLAGLGQQQRAADIQGAQLLETIGRDIRAEDQARLDMSYEDFVRQRDFPIQQYERMAGILRGVPVTPNVEEQRMVSYSPTQQALGAGISALGLYRGADGMNIIDLQERLKDLPETALMQEMQMPSGTAPQFLVLSELKRRKRMRDEYQRQQAQGMQTVAEETITAAGMPQQGIMGLAQGMAPQSAIAQDTGVNDMMQQESVRAPQPEQPMMMAEGGVVKMQPGGDVRQAVDNLLDRNRLRGGFGDNVEYDYAAFLQEMGLSDTPDARDTFRRYQDRMNTQFALEGPNTDPRLFGPEGQRMFLRDIDEDRYAGPGQPSIADVSTDLDVFMPGGVGQSPMMSAPPALGRCTRRRHH